MPTVLYLIRAFICWFLLIYAAIAFLSIIGGLWVSYFFYSPFTFSQKGNGTAFPVISVMPGEELNK